MRKNSQKKVQYREREYSLEYIKLKEKLAMMELLNTVAWKEGPILVWSFWAGKGKGMLAECFRTKTAAENIHLGDIFTISKTTYQKKQPTKK